MGDMIYQWNPKKNDELKSKDRPSFEDAVKAMNTNIIIADFKNPNYSTQRITVVLINNYPHAVVYEIRGKVVWLVTVYPTRKFKKR